MNLNLEEQLFLILVNSYRSPENLPEDYVRAFAIKAKKIAALYKQYSQENNG